MVNACNSVLLDTYKNSFEKSENPTIITCCIHLQTITVIPNKGNQFFFFFFFEGKNLPVFCVMV